MKSSTTKVPALDSVQDAELFRAEELTKVVSLLSTEFCTGVLKTTVWIVGQSGK